MLKKKKEEKPDINSKDINGNSPLHIAVMNANYSLVCLFLYNEAVIDSVNKNLQTPLMIACAKY